MSEMNKIELLSCLVTELGKLVLRSDEKPGNIQEGALKFINSHAYAFGEEAENLTKQIQTPARLSQFLESLMCHDPEPCHLPFTPGHLKADENAGGFLVHIFKGEQDIAPLGKEDANITSKQYYRLIHSLRHDLKRLESHPSLETWLYLLQRYTKWVPAGQTIPHISMYDYTRLKLALGACLTEQQLEQWWQADQNQQPQEAKVVALCAFKIMGKDQFVTALQAEPGMSLLKGANYYLQMLREGLASKLLASFNLPNCNLILEGNDTFVVLVNADELTKLENYEIEVEEFLLQHLQGMISLATHAVTLSVGDLKDKDFNTVFAQLWQDLERKSTQPFARLLSAKPEYHAQVFGPFTKIAGAKEPDNCTIANLGASLEELSIALTKSRWVAVSAIEPAATVSLAQKWQELPAYFKTEAVFSPRKPEANPQTQIYRFGNTDFACQQGTGFKFSEVLPYLTAELEEQEIGKYWAILNVRIDKNSHNQKQSLCGYLSLHEHLQDFFKTYLSSLLREKKYRKLTYMLHTAAHHLTIVCSPQIALMLMEQIHQKFRQFTNEKFTLSGRVSVLPAEYPIHQALFQERKKLDQQKELYNRLVVLGEVISWSLLENLLKTEEKISTVAKLKGKRFLFPLWGLAELYRIRNRGSRDKKSLAMWRNIITYHLNRLGITDNLEGDRGPVYLSLAIQWNHLISQESTPPSIKAGNQE